jgi:hypothetical protein
MTTLEKQMLINRCLKDFVYFYNYYLAPNEIDEFLKHLQEGSEQMYIRQKIAERLARLNENQKVKGKVVLKGDNKIKPKNGANFDLKIIIKDNEKDLKL